MRSATCQILRGEIGGELGTNEAGLDTTDGHEAVHLSECWRMWVGGNCGLEGE